MKLTFASLLSGLLVLSLLAIFSPHSFVLDEALFPPNVELLQRFGFGKRFLLQMENQAPGPLYEFIHLPLRSMTNLEPQGLRVVNLIMFYLVIIVMTTLYCRIKNYKFYPALFAALHLIAVAPLWQVAGLALTEIPAMLFAILSFFLCCKLLQEEGNQQAHNILITSLIAGIALGLSILGRAPYMVILVSFLAVAILRKKQLKRPFLAILPCLLVTLALTIPVFAIWQGFVPPYQMRVESSIKPWHGLLAMAYAGIVGLIIQPQWFIINDKILIGLLVLFVTFFALNFYGLGYEYDPFSTTMKKLFGAKFVVSFNWLVSPALATMGIYFLICCYYKIRASMTNMVYLFSILTAIAVLATSSKISHQFSSRYVAQAAPFLVLIFANIEQKDPTKALRVIAGMTIGFLSLNTYLKVL